MTESHRGTPDATGAQDHGAVVPPEDEFDRIDLSRLMPDDLADRARRESPEFAEGAATVDRPYRTRGTRDRSCARVAAAAQKRSVAR